MVFKAISIRSVLLVEETGVFGENYPQKITNIHIPDILFNMIFL